MAGKLLSRKGGRGNGRRAHGSRVPREGKVSCGKRAAVVTMPPLARRGGGSL